jgi:pimeloyl-ACP methyl ester carboxylesterase
MTHVILVPGFWLDGASWAAVGSRLEAAGLEVEALTLPGKESAAADRAGIGVEQHVAAIVERVDAAAEPVVLVGHSGGGLLIAGTADARPDRVARAIYVDSGPMGEGAVVNDELPVVGADLPFPGWDAFEEGELADMTPKVRTVFEAIAVPEPAGVAREPLHVHDVRRYDVPTTVIASTMTGAVLEQLIESGHPYVRELGLMHDREIVDLPTGHWPQLTRPAELAEAILAALAF